MYSRAVYFCRPLFVPTASLVEFADSLSTHVIDQPAETYTLYGHLDGYSHVYLFTVADEIDFSAQVTTHPSVQNGTKTSLILVREERRGVDEIGRVYGERSEWSDAYFPSVALATKNSEVLEATLVAGSYKLEVSAPDNSTPYRLLINGRPTMKVGEIYIARQIFDLPYFGVILSPYIFMPIFLLLAIRYVCRRRTGFIQNDLNDKL